MYWNADHSHMVLENDDERLQFSNLVKEIRADPMIQVWLRLYMQQHQEELVREMIWNEEVFTIRCNEYDRLNAWSRFWKSVPNPRLGSRDFQTQRGSFYWKWYDDYRSEGGVDPGQIHAKTWLAYIRADAFRREGKEDAPYAALVLTHTSTGRHDDYDDWIVCHPNPMAPAVAWHDSMPMILPDTIYTYTVDRAGRLVYE